MSYLSNAGGVQGSFCKNSNAVFFLALAADYDGTIARHGTVDAQTCDTLERFKRSGRRLILVTGRELPSLHSVFPATSLFDRIVAENGALLYDPATKKERALGPPPPAAFVEYLRRHNVAPVSLGRSIVATWEPHEKVVLEAIRELGLEHQIIFNKGAVMVLPPGVNKATGLAAALRELQLSPINVVGVGDAENDHAFLRACGCAAAVANALPMVKETTDIRLVGDHGIGVSELMERICHEDARLVPPQRHGLVLGEDRSAQCVFLEPHRGCVLIAGVSGGGKSTIAAALTERMVEKDMEFCILDPEGDYDELEHAVSVGDSKTAPSTHETLQLLQDRVANVVVNTEALNVAERPGFFAKLLPRLLSLRAKTGRPHWLIIDEAHHLISASRRDVAQVLPDKLQDVIYITVHPDQVAVEALRSVEYVIALGEGAFEVIALFCRALGEAPPTANGSLERDEILFWRRSAPTYAVPVKIVRATKKRRRHVRKYAEGDLGKELSFYFRGPDNRLKLRAQNLTLFAQIAEGVDAPTWQHHRQLHDYSTWFRTVIKDDELAREAAAVESDAGLDADASRERIIEAVQRRYTAPARERES